MRLGMEISSKQARQTIDVHVTPESGTTGRTDYASKLILFTRAYLTTLGIGIETLPHAFQGS